MLDENEENAIMAVQPLQMMQPAEEGSRQLVTKLPTFTSIRANPIPIQPVPIDNLTDLKYHQYHEEKCSICTSPLRTRLEHWFLESHKMVNPVLRFIKDYYGATASWTSVEGHMRKHCDLSRVGINGIKRLIVAGQDEDIESIKYRELDGAFNGVMLGIDELLSIEVTNRPDLLIEKQKILRQYYKDLADLGKSREDFGVNVFVVLQELFQKIDHNESKQIIASTIREIRKRYQGNV